MIAASAYSSQTPEPGEGRAPEPSMEDILASIRRIIADDQGAVARGPVPANGARRPAPEGERALARSRTPYDDVLALARLVPAGDRGAPQSQTPAPAVHDVPATMQPVADGESLRDQSQRRDGSDVAGLRARLREPVRPEAAQDEDQDMLDQPAAASADDRDGDLLSAPLGESVMSAFETLAATVVLQNTPMLERVMRDVLRPMLKTWLDDNLPGLVERLVRTEIERVARGPRG